MCTVTRPENPRPPLKVARTSYQIQIRSAVGDFIRNIGNDRVIEMHMQHLESGKTEFVVLQPGEEVICDEPTIATFPMLN